MKNVLSFIFGIISAIIYPCIWIIGSGIHLWTVIIAYNESGFIQALFALCLPIVSQIFYFFVSIRISGSIFNTYSIIIMAYLLVWIIMLTSLFISSSLSNKGEL